jgi:cytochrome P450 family 150 subfamily A5
MAANVFSAGQETTVRLLSTALKIMAERPDLQRLLRAERDRIPNFIEETLRLESPVKGDFRLSRTPVSVGGVELPAGTTVMVLNGAANRDPRRFENPGTFDVARANARRHLGLRARHPHLPGRVRRRSRPAWSRRSAPPRTAARNARSR